MSHRYGINGNDLDWSMMEFLNSFTEEAELNIFFKNVYNMKECEATQEDEDSRGLFCDGFGCEGECGVIFTAGDTYYTDTEGFGDSATIYYFCQQCAAIKENENFENGTVIYYPGDHIDVQALLREGKKLDNCVPWYIAQDTNSNFVSLRGDVPDKYLMEHYLRDRNEAEGKIYGTMRFFQNGDESGTLHTYEFYTKKHYEDWWEDQRKSVEVFSKEGFVDEEETT